MEKILVLRWLRAKAAKDSKPRADAIALELFLNAPECKRALATATESSLRPYFRAPSTQVPFIIPEQSTRSEREIDLCMVLMDERANAYGSVEHASELSQHFELVFETWASLQDRGDIVSATAKPALERACNAIYARMSEDEQARANGIVAKHRPPEQWSCIVT
jgi:hypothetical protein